MAITSTTALATICTIPTPSTATTTALSITLRLAAATDAVADLPVKRICYLRSFHHATALNTMICTPITAHAVSSTLEVCAYAAS